MRISRSGTVALLVGGAAAALVGGAGLFMATSASAAATPGVAFTVKSEWSDGYTGEYTLTNPTGTELRGWAVGFDLPPGTTVKKSWSAKITNSGSRYTAKPENGGSIAPGKSRTFGFTTNGTGKPTKCTLNGASCAPGPAPSSKPAKPTKTPKPSAGPTVGPTPSSSATPPPPGPGRTVDVRTAAELTAALGGARPGDTIRLAPGTYDGNFAAKISGTEAGPITLTGPRTAVLAAKNNYALHLEKASHWRLFGFAVTGGAKGIVLDSSNRTTIDNVEVSRTGDEAVHFRTSSSDNVIRNSYIHDTGLKQPRYGEGVYLGSAKSNWSKYGENGGTGPDRSDRNQVLNNTFGPNVSAEHIDIKEGTEGGLVRGNTFNGTGIKGENYADSWVDVKGKGYVIEGNTGTFAPPGVLANGYEVHVIVDGYGCGNVFRGNRSDLGGVGAYAISVPQQKKCGSNPNVVHASNTVTSATKGLTDIEVTP